jgi:hypothetical protein
VFELKEGICDLNIPNVLEEARYIYEDVTLEVCQSLCAKIYDDECSGIMFHVSTTTCYIMAATASYVTPLDPPGTCDDKAQFFRRHRNISESK